VPKKTLLSSWAVLVKLCAPSGSIPWEPHDSPHQHFIMGPVVLLVFCIGHFELIACGVISPATVLPLSRDDHVNNHLFMGIIPDHSNTRCVKSRPSLANQRYRALPQSTLHCVKSGSPLATSERYRASAQSTLRMPSRGLLALAPDQHSIGLFETCLHLLFPTSVPIASHVHF